MAPNPPQWGRETRSFRREQARELAKEIMRREKLQQPTWRLDFTLTFVVAVMAIILAFIPPQTKIAAAVWLLVLFVLGIYPTLHFADLVSDLRRKHLARIASLMLLLALVIGLGIIVWPAQPFYPRLSAKVRNKFMEVLRSQTAAHEELKILCPNNDEEMCIVATQYAELFQRAGWKITGGGIERGAYLKSFPGITIAKKPSPGTLDPNDVEHGLWVLQSPSLLTVIRAFQAIGVKATRQADTALPENTISIYFGPPPS